MPSSPAIQAAPAGAGAAARQRRCSCAGSERQGQQGGANEEEASEEEVSEEEVRRLLTFVVIGGGPTGVEFSGELLDFIEEKIGRFFPQLVGKPEIFLLDAGASILSAFDASLRSVALQSMVSRGVRFLLKERVTDITARTIYFQSTSDPAAKDQLDYGLCVWAAGNAPRPLSQRLAERLGPEQLAVFRKTGRLLVDPWLRLAGVAPGSIFAMGDCALTNATLFPGTYTPPHHPSIFYVLPLCRRS